MPDPCITIIQDTREQRPLKFSHSFIKEVKIQKLDIGDYGAELGDGLRLPLVFERKSIADLYGTLTHGYERFRRQIQRSKETNIRMEIIVEGTLSNVGCGITHSERTPESLLYQLFYIHAKYGIRTIFCTGAAEAGEYIQQVFIAHEKHRINSQK